MSSFHTLSSARRLRTGRPRRSGIILLVVLGMLTLFSVLGVSYLVFTSRQRTAAFNINRAETAEVDPDPWLDETIKQVLVGAGGPESSLWGHDLLGDLYGMRDAVRGQLTAPANYVVNDNLVAPDVLLDGFIRVPTQLYTTATYPNQRVEEPLFNLPEREYPQTPTAAPTTNFPIDDSLTGRILTFTDGPLAGLSMRVVRYFGNHTGAANGRNILSGQLVLDVRPHLNRSVTLDSLGATYTLGEWIERHRLPPADPDYVNISLLFYDQLAAAGSGAVPLSEFYLNGEMLNGPGLGWDVARDGTMNATGSEMNLNETISVDFDPTVASPTVLSVKGGGDFEGTTAGKNIPVPMQGHYALYRKDPTDLPTNRALDYLRDLPSGDTDEPYDAPDDQNWWLSYLPDNPPGAAPLGSPAPSFVRPGLIHWLVNQQASSGSPNLQDLSVDRLREILRAIQRATLRPIPIRNDPTMPVSISARGDGVLQLDYRNFTGGHPSNVALGDAINYAEIDPVVLAQRIRALAQQLVGQDVDGDGQPDWDVDNNGDGVPDSVWIDIGLPLNQSDDGTLAKPLVALLIEDLGGRVNVNLSGNLSQARGVIPRSAEGVLYRSGVPMGPTHVENNLPSGFGYGPAEIDIRALFVHPSVQFGNGSLNLLRRRLTSRTIGGVEYVAAGHLIDPFTNDGNDFLGVLRQPLLANLHRPSNAQGLPVDKWGRATISLGINGGLMVSGASAPIASAALAAGNLAGDSADDPYEFDIGPGGQPDNLFTLADLEGVLRFDDFDRDALDSALVALAEAHFRSASVSADIVNDTRRSFANSVTTASNSVAEASGTLPSEFRNLLPGAQRALPPQSTLTSATVGGLTPQQRNGILMQLLPKEVLSGGKLDLNRPFGNGVDDDGDGVVDDPEELRAAIQVFYRDYTGTPSNTIYTTGFSDVTIGQPGLLYQGPPPPTNPFPEPTPQALFARHLYVMAMILVRDLSGTGDVFDFTHGTAAAIVIDPSNTTNRFDTASSAYVTNPSENEYRAWQLAQWAINVADFRDPDAIMSRFDYDVFPFDGWHITTAGSPARPTFRTVWGMEYPELALEESIAFHDRRVRDTNLDPSGEPRYQGGTFRDNDTDQWRVPQGSLFLELRSTRSPDFLREPFDPNGPSALPPPDDSDDIAQAWSVPAELYAQVNVGSQVEYMLDLARLAPDRNPVWRVAISRAHPGPQAVGATDRELSGDEMLQPVGSQNLRAFTGPDSRLTASLQPNRPNFFGPVVNNGVERVVWFTNFNPDDGGAGDTNAGDGVVNFAPLDSQRIERIFYNRFAETDYTFNDTTVPGLQLYLRGGQYAVIGPRTFTPVGALDIFSGAQTHDPTTDEPLVPYTEYESRQSFNLQANLFQHFLISGNASTPTVENGSGIGGASIRSPIGIVAAANAPGGWAGPAVTGGPLGSNAIGLSVSEPLPYPAPAGINQYYPSPTEPLDVGFPVDSYYNYDTGNGAFPDEPFDGQPYAELFQVFDINAQWTGTRERFKTAYLQRLADPTQPHDENLNPYITVDYITIDLTVFNGSDSNRQETEAGPPPVTEWIDNNDPDPLNNGIDEAFATRYKTGRALLQAKDTALTTNENLSHSVNTYPPVVTAKATAAAELNGHAPYFDYTLNLDDLAHPDRGGNVDNSLYPPRMRETHSSSLGYANAAYGPRWTQTGAPTAAVANYIGTPYANWFSSVTWLNRPYVSPAELMWVPTTSAARFASQFGTTTADTGFTVGSDFYEGTGNPIGTTGRQEYDRVFPHLWNYFSGNANDFTTSPNLWRILDWVKVPAPYDFENDFLSTNANPLQFPAVSLPAQSSFGDRLNYFALGGAGATSHPDTWTSGAATNQFWLNRWMIEGFRTPANILDSPFRQGRINLNTIKNERVYRALMNGVTEPTDPNPGAFYTEFVASRRGYTPSGSDPEDMNLDPANSVFDSSRASQFAGAFRPSSASDIAPLAGDRVTQPLAKTMMRPTGVIDALGDEPLLARPLTATGNAAEWRLRSAAHQQLSLTRLNNLATDQSNVFAVWVTVGLFEVDGSTLSVGQEVGSDLGQVRRYRSFHIIDRSIPVQVEPGVLNNAMETVVLSRRLE